MENLPKIVRRNFVVTADFVQRKGDGMVNAQIAMEKMRALADADKIGIKNPDTQIMFVTHYANPMADCPIGAPAPKTWQEAMNPNAEIIIIVREKE